MTTAVWAVTRPTPRRGHASPRRARSSLALLTPSPRTPTPFARNSTPSNRRRPPRFRRVPDPSTRSFHHTGASHMSHAPTMFPARLTSRPEIEAEIARRLAAERARLERESGIQGRPVEHFKRPAELAFTADQRDRVTILIGGLT